jgi:steroid Delta-isomerase
MRHAKLVGIMMSAATMARSYAEALEKTEARAVRLDVVEREQVLGRLAQFFANMSVEKVRAMAGSVYARDAYLNDSLKVLEGLYEIEEYFAKSVSAARVMDYRFLDVAEATERPDYYVRWAMTLERRWLNGGEPIQAEGVSHFRFDSSGRLILHRDFWNTGSAFYERIPVLGWLLRRVRSRI